MTSRFWGSGNLQWPQGAAQVARMIAAAYLDAPSELFSLRTVASGKREIKFDKRLYIVRRSKIFCIVLRCIQLNYITHHIALDQTTIRLHYDPR